MAFKFVILLAFVAAASSAIIPAAPVAVATAPVLAKTVELEEFDPHPQYQYGYDVQDALSGDSKGHVEERDGDVVRGEYSLVDPDGFKRTVTYTADPVNGFNAVVRRDPIVVAAAPIVKAAPVVAAAPAPIVRAAPVVAAAPAPFVRAAPVVAAAPAPFVRAAPVVAAAPAPFVRTAPFAVAAAPAVVSAAPLRYTAPAPLTYTAAAPAVAYRHF